MSPLVELASATSPILAFVGDALADLGRQRGRLGLITVPAPVAPLEALSAFDEPAILWDPPGGPAVVGMGETAVLSATGPERIASITSQARALWPRIESIVHPGARHGGTPAFLVRPRLFGGFAFAENAAASAPWRDFGDARFVLPSWLYVRDSGRAWLGLAVDSDTLPGAAAQYLARLDRLLERCEVAGRTAPLGPRGPGRAAVKTVHEVDPRDWRDRVENIRAAIAARQCEKIVAARCTRVELDEPADPIAVLAELDRRYPDCYRFAFRFGPGAVFLGATPERLIERREDRVFTEALAGSIAAASELAGPALAPARALLASEKDRGEQSLVVQAICDVLAPFCGELDVAAEPGIRALQNVLHLETRIAGTLCADTHVLDLVAALHPTPAVGGVPTAAAMAWIAEHEKDPRGWYAAPVGWFDAGGQGELAVAIRSGLLCGTTAHVYVGAGIVRDSDPEAELAETRLKQRAMLGALGIAL